jgi:hypothetical protein
MGLRGEKPPPELWHGRFALLIRIQKVPTLNLNPETAILTEVFVVFSVGYL